MDTWGRVRAGKNGLLAHTSATSERNAGKEGNGWTMWKGVERREEEGRERRDEGEQDSRFVVMQDAKGDEPCPPPQSTIPFSSLCIPFQMASRRTSFPRLTASRYAEGNENNEIQRSSVTYARRAPSLNSHLYYLSGSKSIQPSHPPVLIRLPPGGFALRCGWCVLWRHRPLPTCLHLKRETTIPMVARGELISAMELRFLRMILLILFNSTF